MDPLKIGNVIRIQSGRVEVVITVNDLNLLHDDRTYRVGQLSSYVTIPMDDRTLVGFVTGVGRQEVATIDVQPELIMHVQLLGELKDGRFVRGISEYPIIGAYAVRTNMFDVWVMVAGGFIGYAFYMFKFPAAPLVLGIILAPLADENLRRALLLFDNNGFGYFAKEYIGHVLLLIIVIVFVEGFRRGLRNRKAMAAAAAKVP